MHSPLTVEHISKNFSQKPVLSEISLSLKKGEIYGLVGVNGVGKTTLLKIILDLIEADQGSVSFFSESHRIPKSRRQLAYLPEKFTPSSFLKGREFLSLSLSFYNLPYNHKEALSIAASIDLKPEALDQFVSRYSKGMGQKLGIIATLLAKRPLLILDEPMSGLDPQARIEFKTLLKSYQEAGNTILFTSHILADIEEICDRVAIMHDTRLVYEGTAEALLKEHQETSLERAFLSVVNSA